MLSKRLVMNEIDYVRRQNRFIATPPYSATNIQDLDCPAPCRRAMLPL
jgi:hypothetical protein